MSNMKIAFVIDDTLDKPDGVQQYVLALGEWYGRQGHEVHYLCGASKRDDVSNVHSLSRNINVTFNGNRLSVPLPANRRRIRELLERERFDVIHVQLPCSPFLAGRIVRAAPSGAAIVGTFHILPLTRLVRVATSVLGLWLQPALRRFDQVFAVSPAAQIFAKEAFRLPEVMVMPNVADVAKFRDAVSFEKYDDEILTIMFLGRLVPRKGCATLLQAASILRQRSHYPFRIVVCGKGPLAADLKAQAALLDLTDIVEFTGFVTEADKPRYVASADIMAFPSSGGESFGIVLIEAMASDRPAVLAGDNAGYASVMDERPDLLFPAGDAGVLADKLVLLMEDTRFRKGILNWQRSHVQQFDVAAVGKRLLMAYSKLLRNKTQA